MKFLGPPLIRINSLTKLRLSELTQRRTLNLWPEMEPRPRSKVANSVCSPCNLCSWQNYSHFSEPYSEEVKLKIYAATGVISTLLVVAILGFTVMTVKKRNDRKMPFAFSDRVDQSRKSQLDISNPLQPWTTNTDVRDAFPNLIRSNAWFDSLHR